MDDFYAEMREFLRDETHKIYTIKNSNRVGNKISKILQHLSKVTKVTINVKKQILQRLSKVKQSNVDVLKIKIWKSGRKIYVLILSAIIAIVLTFRPTIPKNNISSSRNIDPNPIVTVYSTATGFKSDWTSDSDTVEIPMDEISIVMKEMNEILKQPIQMIDDDNLKSEISKETLKQILEYDKRILEYKKEIFEYDLFVGRDDKIINIKNEQKIGQVEFETSLNLRGGSDKAVKPLDEFFDPVPETENEPENDQLIRDLIAKSPNSDIVKFPSINKAIQKFVNICLKTVTNPTFLRIVREMQQPMDPHIAGLVPATDILPVNLQQVQSDDAVKSRFMGVGPTRPNAGGVRFKVEGGKQVNQENFWSDVTFEDSGRLISPSPSTKLEALSPIFNEQYGFDSSKTKNPAPAAEIQKRLSKLQSMTDVEAVFLKAAKQNTEYQKIISEGSPAEINKFVKERFLQHPNDKSPIYFKSVQEAYAVLLAESLGRLQDPQKPDPNLFVRPKSYEGWNHSIKGPKPFKIAESKTIADKSTESLLIKELEKIGTKIMEQKFVYDYSGYYKAMKQYEIDLKEFETNTNQSSENNRASKAEGSHRNRSMRRSKGTTGRGRGRQNRQTPGYTKVTFCGIVTIPVDFS